MRHEGPGGGKERFSIDKPQVPQGPPQRSMKRPRNRSAGPGGDFGTVQCLVLLIDKQKSLMEKDKGGVRINR